MTAYHRGPIGKAPAAARSARVIILTVVLTMASAVEAARAADCTNPVAQVDLNRCAAEDLGRADAALNAAYGRLIKEPALADRLDRLRAAERAWVDYRTAQCAFEGAAFEGGSMQPMAISGCAEALTKRRTAELTKALACAHDPGTC